MAKILVVDDELVYLSSLCDELSMFEGHKVVQAHSAKEARILIERAGAEPFDLVFSDYTMPPGETGVGLAKWIGQTRGNRLPVIIHSGFSEARIMAEESDYGELKKSGVIAMHLDKVHNRLEEKLQKIQEVLSRPKVPQGSIDHLKQGEQLQ